MLKKFPKTLSIGLSGLLALSVGVANAAEATAKRAPNVLHEMVPHVILPETIQYNKTAKNLPGAGYTVANSPYVATYVAYPSYQVPYTAVFRPIGQAVYPVSPPLLPAPLPKEHPAPVVEAEAVEEQLALLENEGRDVVLSHTMNEPIRLAASEEAVVPMLPMPSGAVRQTAIFCPQPPKPPAAWAFSSPLFKVASVPAGWGGQTGSIMHHSPKGSVQHLGFQPAIDPSTGAAIPQPMGVPYGHPMMGYGQEQNVGVQTQILPNGMILLTMPPDHGQCGLIRCRTGHAPRTMLLPPAGVMPQIPGITPSPAPQNVTMSGGFGVPYMSVASQQLPMQMMPPQMMPQMMPMQTVPVTAMTPMGPAIVGYQQVPMMNPMMMNPMMNPQLPQLPQVSMAMATPNPMVLSQMSAVAEESGNDTDAQAAGTDPAAENQMALVATPFGYAIQVPADALQADTAAQLAQMQQALMQSQMQMQMQANPYAGLYVTPFGTIAMNQAAGQFGGFGQNMMMNASYPMGMTMPGQFMPHQGGLTVSDVLQIMSFMNSNKPQRRARMAERLAERRENRKASGNDPFTQLMEAWTTPYAAPDTTLRMPSRNAYPYGHFGVQASPMGTANYGGFHNLYLGTTHYPGLY